MGVPVVTILYGEGAVHSNIFVYNSIVTIHEMQRYQSGQVKKLVLQNSGFVQRVNGSDSQKPQSM